MSPNKTLRTTSFRLAALYAVFFVVSVGILLALVYWYILGAMQRHLEASVSARLDDLRNVYDTGGIDALEQAVRRDTQRRGSRYRYALIDPKGKLVAGTLTQTNLNGDWIELEIERRKVIPGEQDYSLRGRGLKLDDDWLLWVGHDSSNVHELREHLAGAVSVALVLTVMLALAGGVFTGQQVSRRVESMNRTARSIMEGDLSRRLTVTGSGDEFDRLAEQFNAMLERIQVLMENLRQVSSDIAHDLRTPLSHLRQRLEELRGQTGTTDGCQQAVDEAIGETDAILGTFEALLRIAQIESGQRRADFTRVGLSQLLQELVEIYTPVAEDMEHELVADIADGIEVQGDRRLLAQMFVNMIENALRHTPPGVRVELELRVDPVTGVVASVQDNGPGVPARERNKVFQRFYRLDSSRTTPGSGLGLSLVAAVAELHGLCVELADNDPGLRVNVRFPANT